MGAKYIMPQQLQIVLPEETIQLIDKLTEKNASPDDLIRQRSNLIDEAVKFFMAEKQREDLKQQLKEGGIERAKRDLNLAEEWFELEEEAW